ncbi:hypothetical protein HC891_07850 [Candidatus Gracilibacteria bacterium]|nr:hypothetical protein [Candidatus Gracilibacteria bacterium]
MRLLWPGLMLALLLGGCGQAAAPAPTVAPVAELADPSPTLIPTFSIPSPTITLPPPTAVRRA